MDSFILQQVVPEVSAQVEVSSSQETNDDEENPFRPINVTINMDKMNGEKTKKIIEDLKSQLEEKDSAYEELCLVVTAKETVTF